MIFSYAKSQKRKKKNLLSKIERTIDSGYNKTHPLIMSLSINSTASRLLKLPPLSTVFALMIIIRHQHAHTKVNIAVFPLINTIFF